MCRSLVRFWDLKTALRDAVYCYIAFATIVNFNCSVNVDKQSASRQAAVVIIYNQLTKKKYCEKQKKVKY